MEDDKKLKEDAESSITLNPLNIKGLAHPLRLKILGALRIGGPATASGLAETLGESSGATSYHLRQLEKFGFVVEDSGRASKKERWWKAAHRNTRFDEASLVGPGMGTEGHELLSVIASTYYERMIEWIEALPEAPETWRGAGTMSDWILKLNPRQARELEGEIEAVLARYPRFEAGELRAEGEEFVGLQLQILPRLGQ